MSIVAVHGPHTFGSKAVVGAGSLLATVNPTNGLQWDFKYAGATTRPDQDFSWAFPTNGTPTPQALADPLIVTYATAGSKTATLTVANTSRTVGNKALTNNVATLTTTGAHGFKAGQIVTVTGVDATFNGTYTIASTPSGTTFTYAKVNADVTSAASGGTVASAATQEPAAGTYNITVTAVAGVAPLEGEEATPTEAAEEPPPVEEGPFDPADHTVSEVEDYVNANPDERDLVREQEEDGKGRVTLLTWLDSFVPEG